MVFLVVVIITIAIILTVVVNLNVVVMTKATNMKVLNLHSQLLIFSLYLVINITITVAKVVIATP